MALGLAFVSSRLLDFALRGQGREIDRDMLHKKYQTLFRHMAAFSLISCHTA